MTVLALPAWVPEEGSPYIGALYGGLGAEDILVVPMTPRRLLRSRYHLVHFHWPESAATHPSLVVSAARSLRLLAAVALARLRGARVVWTAHNLRSHERSHPRLECLLMRLFVALVDAYIVLSPALVDPLVRRYPRLGKRPGWVVSHGHLRGVHPGHPDRPASRRALGLPEHARLVVFFGLIRPSKRVAELVRAFRSLPDEELALLVAGAPQSDRLRREIEEAGAGDPRVRLFLELVPHERVAEVLGAADLVVVPISEPVVSSSAILALSFDRPVLLPALGPTRELAAVVGSEWVRTYEGGLTGEVLGDALRWAGTERRPARAPVERLDWGEATAKTARAFRDIAGVAGHSEA